MSIKRELPLLTGVRFLAAFYVFLFHLHIHVPLAFLPRPVQAVLEQGALGVNFFFVLSGFLLGYAHLADFEAGQRPDWPYYRWFMYKRFSRIYPVYFAGLLLSLVVSSSVGQRPPAGILLLDATLLQSYVWGNAMWWYGVMAWSVSTEVFFYLLLPLLLPLLLRGGRRATWWLLGACCLAGALPGLLYNVFPGLLSYNLAYVFPPLRLAEFVAGVLAALLVFRYRLVVSAGWAVGALVALAAWLATTGPVLGGFVVHNVVVIPALVLLLAALAAPRPAPGLRWLGSPLLVYLGRISYSFYIAQYPLMTLLEAYQKRHAAGYLTGAALLAANLLLAALLYSLVEQGSHKHLLALGSRTLRPA